MSDNHDYLVQVPIKTGALKDWALHYDAHVAHLKPYILDGTIVFGGPTLAAHPRTADDPIEARSSVLMFHATTEARVREIIGNNPFADAGMWEMEKLVVAPFKCGVRTAM
ncbi:hypothetical protein N7457_003378 [Penicillium paradoxum]|uniref:uncharacterized protein n=1 Tax=Penicillium paradoxum TaxID=176176 RepID=UPI0025466BB5|nr:uncharacterized protein N7457_003378 [Penicillium paradoxum]KAJ5788388.1 hypothetical protein N7457_003378 [Penicillium paradoxum]